MNECGVDQVHVATDGLRWKIKIKLEGRGERGGE